MDFLVSHNPHPLAPLDDKDIVTPSGDDYVYSDNAAQSLVSGRQNIVIEHHRNIRNDYKGRRSRIKGPSQKALIATRSKSRNSKAGRASIQVFSPRSPRPMPVAKPYHTYQIQNFPEGYDPKTSARSALRLTTSSRSGQNHLTVNQSGPQIKSADSLLSSPHPVVLGSSRRRRRSRRSNSPVSHLDSNGYKGSPMVAMVTTGDMFDDGALHMKLPQGNRVNGRGETHGKRDVMKPLNAALMTFEPIKFLGIPTDITGLKSLTAKRKVYTEFVPSKYTQGHPGEELELSKDSPDLFFVSHDPAQNSILAKKQSAKIANESKNRQVAVQREAQLQAMQDLDMDLKMNNTHEPPGWWLALYGFTREEHEAMAERKLNAEVPSSSAAPKPLMSVTRAKSLFRQPSVSKSRPAPVVVQDVDDIMRPKNIMSKKRTLWIPD